MSRYFKQRNYECNKEIKEMIDTLVARHCVCELCGKVFISDWSDAEAAAEYEKTFDTDFDREEVGVVCTACYLGMLDSEINDLMEDVVGEMSDAYEKLAVVDNLEKAMERLV